MGKTGSRNHCISDQVVASPAVLGPVRPLMEDTLSKPSEHVRLCVEQIIVPYLGMILLNCFSKMFKIVQFYCYSFRAVKWSPHS